MAHKDVRIEFMVGDRRFEAVRFLKEGEVSVSGDEMLARTAGQNGGAIGEEDEKFLREHLGELPTKLRGYWLVTDRRSPDHPRDVSCFVFFDGGGWCRDWDWLGGQWGDDGLVVRRCV